MIDEIKREIIKVYPDEDKIEEILLRFEAKVKESLVSNILLNKRNDRVNKVCWREKGCIFNSNNSSKYMKCWKENYSVDKCKEDNYEYYVD